MSTDDDDQSQSPDPTNIATSLAQVLPEDWEFTLTLVRRGLHGVPGETMTLSSAELTANPEFHRELLQQVADMVGQGPESEEIIPSDNRRH